jgi:uncharacterized protein YjiS (DUF1127 family)
MTNASLSASILERAMSQPSPSDRPGNAPVAAMPAVDPQPASRLGALATRLTAWRQRAKQARDFRGFDQRQLRDLGLNHFDQW